MQLPIQNQVLELEEVEVARNLVIQPRHVGDVVLHPETQLRVPGAVDPVLVQLLPQRLLAVHPLQVLTLALVLESKVRDLSGTEQREREL